MKRIGLTQRVDVISDYGERRDALDQRWYDLLQTVGILPIPLPNIATSLVETYLDTLNLDGIILTGGNTLACLNEAGSVAAPERDAFEHALIDVMSNQNRPILGVCRGMQILYVHFGGQLTPVADHVATRHPLNACHPAIDVPSEVNSFHHWGIACTHLQPIWQPLAQDELGYVELFRHQHQPMFGMMWHPEREADFNHLDLQFIERIFL
ncbi:MAG: gamma-glutamyl-gamma-aminobutyrate hydrolase family protein [Shewanellaceae bacterium]|nr:gamma-glutamyl-gamma-aminobutyrate hydrolase family protein [Shewanellaceae bacterium]